MAESVLFPDAVQLLRTALVDAGVGTVVHDIPNPRPVEFVTLIRTGGAPAHDVVVDPAQITVDSWAASSPAAMALAQQVRSLLQALRGTVISGTAVYGVRELAGPADLPDPDSGAPRVRQSFQIGFRGQSTAATQVVGDEPVPISGLVPNDQTKATANRLLIQAALDAAAVVGPLRPPFTGAGGLGGGTVYLPIGWYWIDAPTGGHQALTVGNATELAGLGWGTVLALKDGVSTTATPVSVVGFANNTAGCVVRDLRINGNGAAQTDTNHQSHGITMNRTGTVELYDGEFRVENVTIFGCAGTGLDATGGANTATIRKVSAYSNYIGFDAKTDQKFMACVAGQNTYKGFNAYAGTNCMFTACKAFGGQVGWSVSYSDTMSLTGCESEDTEIYGYDITSANNIVLDGCQAYRTSGTSGLRAAIALHDDGAGTLPNGVSIRSFTAKGYEDTPNGLHPFTQGIRIGILGVNNSFQGTFAGVTGALVDDMTGGTTPGDQRMTLEINNEAGTQRIAYAATITPNPYDGGTVLVDLTGNITVANPADGHTGSRLTFILTQDATGSRTVAWGANYVLNGWTMPAAANAAGRVDFVRTPAGKWVA